MSMPNDESSCQLELFRNYAHNPAGTILAPESKNPMRLDPGLSHTENHADCPACMAANRALALSAADLAKMRFEDAADAFMLLRRQSTALRPRTHEATQNYFNALGKFFAPMRLCDITPGSVRAYQIARLNNLLRVNGQERSPWRKKAAHSTINHEIIALRLLMTAASLWHRIAAYSSALPVPKWSPRNVLSEEQEAELWKTAARHPEASLAYWVATITNNTTASGIELRGLRLKHLFLNEAIGEIYVPEDAVKNNSRPRKIALNSAARWAIEQCLKRAIRLGSCEPDHYLFPFRVKRNNFDPAQPCSRSWLRKSWNNLRAATGFRELRPHDLRHQCITAMLERGVNPETVIAIAGHVGRKMLEYYSHQRRQVKYAAVLTLEAKPVASEPASKSSRKLG